jgi:hypothetical protein
MVGLTRLIALERMLPVPARKRMVEFPPTLPHNRSQIQLIARLRQG